MSFAPYTSSASRKGSAHWPLGRSAGQEDPSGLGSETVGGNQQALEALRPREVGAAFLLPGGRALTGDWNQVQTVAPTEVAVTVDARGLSLSFWPPLEVDAQWPISNVDVGGLRYDWALGAVTSVHTRSTQLGVPVGGFVAEALQRRVEALLGATPAGQPGYQPFEDPDLAGTLASLMRSLQSTQAASHTRPGEVGAEDLTGLRVFGTAVASRGVELGQGNLQLAAGATLRLEAQLEGSAATFDREDPRVQRLVVDAKDLVLMNQGAPLVALESFTVERGGAVDVTRFRPLGLLRQAGRLEDWVKVVGWLVAIEGGVAPAVREVPAEKRATDTLVERELEKRIGQALVAAVLEHHAAIPGLDLRRVLGLG